MNSLQFPASYRPQRGVYKKTKNFNRVQVKQDWRSFRAKFNANLNCLDIRDCVFLLNSWNTWGFKTIKWLRTTRPVSLSVTHFSKLWDSKLIWKDIVYSLFHIFTVAAQPKPWARIPSDVGAPARPSVEGVNDGFSNKVEASGDFDCDKRAVWSRFMGFVVVVYTVLLFSWMLRHRFTAHLHKCYRTPFSSPSTRDQVDNNWAHPLSVIRFPT